MSGETSETGSGVRGMMELAGVSFVFPDVFGRKVLVLGLGGGCDAITAYAVAGWLQGAR
jgi:hypothetical protein